MTTEWSGNCPVTSRVTSLTKTRFLTRSPATWLRSRHSATDRHRSRPRTTITGTPGWVARRGRWSIPRMVGVDGPVQFTVRRWWLSLVPLTPADGTASRPWSLPLPKRGGRKTSSMDGGGRPYRQPRSKPPAVDAPATFSTTSSGIRLVTTSQTWNRHSPIASSTAGPTSDTGTGRRERRRSTVVRGVTRVVDRMQRDLGSHVELAPNRHSLPNARDTGQTSETDWGSEGSRRSEGDHGNRVDGRTHRAVTAVSSPRTTRSPQQALPDRPAGLSPTPTDPIGVDSPMLRTSLSLSGAVNRGSPEGLDLAAGAGTIDTPSESTYRPRTGDEHSFRSGSGRPPMQRATMTLRDTTQIDQPDASQYDRLSKDTDSRTTASTGLGTRNGPTVDPTIGQEKPAASEVGGEVLPNPEFDRLVDRVYDAFERKLRIERERRGL